MQLETQLALRSAVTAEAETATIAEPSLVTLRRTLDQNGRVVREGDDIVSLTITQSSTKEFSQGIRTLVRVDRAANGKFPAATAYAVVASSDTAEGRASGASALLTLFTSLSNNNAAESLTLDSGYQVQVNSEDFVSPGDLKDRWLRLLRGEA